MAEFLVSVRTSIDDSIQEFGMHYTQTSGTDDPLVASRCARAWWVQCGLTFRSCLATDVRVEHIFVRKITEGTRPAWKENLQGAAGTRGPDAHSAQNVLLLNLRNNAGLLKRAGRLFVSGPPKSDLDAGVWSTAFLEGNVQNWIDKLITIPQGGTGAEWGGQMKVRKTITDGVKLDPPEYVPVTEIDATPELGTMHKRKGRLTGYTADVVFP